MEKTTESVTVKRRRPLLRWISITLVVMSILPFVLRSIVESRYGRQIHNEVTHVSGKTAAVVFGAAVRNGYPTTVLRDRLDSAIALYRAGQVDALVMSGDGRTITYNEPAVMARYAEAQGVPAAAITLDPLGLRTYDTCYRLREVFDLDDVVLVTQAYHLPRALFTCELLGVDAVGFSADQREYRSAGWYNFRELLALVVAAWDGVLQSPPSGV
jgi:SanA protein